ncbi:type II secretion system protein GspE [Candidatus Aerophobetes bacterium]|uniref:protein-secreting ATPase n=1 Tax=Aerophobetes bacterium TaxID=2030807 RepID=A0A2A4YG80_UNCAE|nr:MAG: type II secretion system protein GspE [Candidatus Aerophobetes bacterium]
MLDEVEEKNRSLAKRFGLKVYETLSDFYYVKEKISKVPYSFAKKRLILPVDKEEGVVIVALAHPDDLQALQELKCMISSPVKEIYASKEVLEAAIEKCYHQKDREASDYFEDLSKNENTENGEEDTCYDLLEQKSDAPVIKMLNVIFIEAVQQVASDIHFEPTENNLEVRYRIDGVLQKRHTPPKEYQTQLLTRIKVMSKLDIAEHRLPQDGRLKLSIGPRQIDFRVSTVPVVYGERIVLRILDKSNIVLGLDRIGLPKETCKNFKKHISQNQGIVLVTGPTGSGKTTTLYSGISEISSSEINIMTIEDPVEYKLPGMAQIGVNPKIDLDFARGLRSILRQDPDVIMIGEIRDRETAEIAIQSSLTGHMVLSTLHTNDAPSALTRLVDMGIEPYLLTSSVIAVLAQRLVRVVCPNCKKGYTPNDEELSELGLLRKDLKDNTLYKGEGCESCFFSGYKGRRGIYELMDVNTRIKRQLLRSPDALELQRVAFESGMSSLRNEGAKLAASGVTSSAEVLRVTRQISFD